MHPQPTQPQPTRYGRIPVAPPEEELAAMLAMDNYFEFPSESESDDEDFVLPPSRLQQDDEEDEEAEKDAAEQPASTSRDMEDNDGDDVNDRSSSASPSKLYDWFLKSLAYPAQPVASSSTSLPPILSASATHSAADPYSLANYSTSALPGEPFSAPLPVQSALTFVSDISALHSHPHAFPLQPSPYPAQYDLQNGFASQESTKAEWGPADQTIPGASALPVTNILASDHNHAVLNTSAPAVSKSNRHGKGRITEETNMASTILSPIMYANVPRHDSTSARSDIPVEFVDATTVSVAKGKARGTVDDKPPSKQAGKKRTRASAVPAGAASGAVAVGTAVKRHARGASKSPPPQAYQRLAIPPGSPNTQAEIRRQRNKEQSRVFRERKKMREGQTDEKVQALQAENDALRRQIEELNARLQASQRESVHYRAMLSGATQ